MSRRHLLRGPGGAGRLGPLLYFAALLLIALSLLVVDRMRGEPEQRGVPLATLARPAA